MLRQAGHEADGVLDEQLGGTLDPDLATVCRRELRSLLTLDLDFADIRVYPPEQYPGIVVMRPRRQDKYTLIDILRRLLPAFHSERLAGHLWIVDEQRIRIRP